MPNSPDDRAAELERLAGTPQPSLIREFIAFLKDNKKWWLLPILLVLGAFGILMALSSSAAAPFIYTLF